MAVDVQNLPDNDLIAFLRPHGREETASASCLATSVIIPAAFIILAYLTWTSSLPTDDKWMISILLVFAFVPCAIGILFAIEFVLKTPYRYRIRHHFAELRRRYEIPTFRKAIQDARNKALDSQRADWVIVLKGSGLPHGGIYFVSIALHSNPMSGEIHIQQTPFWLAGFKESWLQNSFVRLGAKLETKVAQQLVERIEAIFPDRFNANEVRAITDGFPCEMAVLRRDPSTEKKISCNAYALPDDHFVRSILDLGNLYDSKRTRGDTIAENSRDIRS